MSHDSHLHDGRHGARQKKPFNLERAHRLDNPSRFEYLAPADVAEFLDIPRGGRVVDFGAGTGTYAIEIARRRPDAEVFAVDEMPEMLDRLRAKPAASELANLKPLLATEIAPLRGTIDRVLALNVLHELGDGALESVATLLAPAGAVVFIDWNSEVERPHGPPADQVYSPAEARARLESLDFKIELELLFLYHYALLAR